MARSVALSSSGAGSVAFSSGRTLGSKASYTGVAEGLGMLGNRPLNFALKQRIPNDQAVAWGLLVGVAALGIFTVTLSEIKNPQRCGSRAPLTEPSCTDTRERGVGAQKWLRSLEAERGK